MNVHISYVTIPLFSFELNLFSHRIVIWWPLPLLDQRKTFIFNVTRVNVTFFLWGGNAVRHGAAIVDRKT